MTETPPSALPSDKAPFSRELYRATIGGEFRAVALTVEADGAVDLSAQDMGPTVQEMWGDADYEFGVKVPAEAAPALIAALLAELYEGREDAVDALHALVKRRNVPHEWWSWA